MHTGNREFSCPHCSQRFGRKDHMTRHAKKTHQQLYEPSDRQRLTSAPGGAAVSLQEPVPARNARKERSVSDPGPMHSMHYNPDYTALRPLVNPNGVVAKFQKLGTNDTYNDTSSNFSYVMREQDKFSSSSEDCSESLYSLPPSSNTISVIKSCSNSANQMFTIPEKMDSHLGVVKSESPCSNLYPKSESDDQQVSTYKQEMEESKMETYSEDSNSTEQVMKEFMAEKDKIDFDSFIKEIRDDMFDEDPLRISPVKVYLEVKEEPKSRPATPIVEQNSVLGFDGNDELEGYAGLVVEEKIVVAKPVFLRTQSQDSLTRTKNPVLPSIHTEGTLVVPEPKQVRYSSQDPFTLSLEDESHTLAELKGSLFLNDDQSYFQPWN